MTTMSEYYTMSDERFGELLAALGMRPDSASAAVARVYLLTDDWPGRDAHQRWLDTASVIDIAAWMPTGWPMFLVAACESRERPESSTPDPAQDGREE